MVRRYGGRKAIRDEWNQDGRRGKKKGIRGARTKTTVVVRRKNAAEQRKTKEE
jgi:hypothetical protein